MLKKITADLKTLLCWLKLFEPHIMFYHNGFVSLFLPTSSSKADSEQQAEYHHAGPFSPGGKANKRQN